MKRFNSLTLILTTVFCGAMLINGQTAKFDITSYQPPKGWQTQDKAGAKVFTITDQAKGTVCLITLYKSEQSSGNLTTDFAQSWQKYVTANLGKSDFPKTSTDKTAQTWDLIAGGSIVETGELGKMAASMVVMSKSGRKVTVLAVFNSADYLPIYEQFLENLRFDANSSPTSSIPIKTSGEKFEIWMGISAGAFNGLSGKYDLLQNKVDWKIVYANGDYFDQLPMEGFLNFDRSATKGNWGRFTFSGGSGSFKNKFEDIKVRSISATKLEKVGWTFSLYKVASVEGAKLSGAYSSIASARKDPYYRQAGCRQVMYFGNDGSFDDRGIMTSNCSRPNEYPDRKPGTGTYQITNYTLILKYSDGHVITKAFSGLNDKPLTSDDSVLYVGGNPWFKIL